MFDVLPKQSRGLRVEIIVLFLYHLISLLLVTIFSLAGDDVVNYRNGLNSAEVLSSTGFRDLAFRTYNG